MFLKIYQPQGKRGSKKIFIMTQGLRENCWEELDFLVYNIPNISKMSCFSQQQWLDPVKPSEKQYLSTNLTRKISTLTVMLRKRQTW